MLVHVEVQAPPERDLPGACTATTHCISDRYEHRVASLAALGDGDPAWRPGIYNEELWAYRAQFHHPHL